MRIAYQVSSEIYGGFFYYGITLRANVTNGQTFGGNSQKIDSAYIPKLGRPSGQTNHSILRLAESQYIFEKIEIN